MNKPNARTLPSHSVPAATSASRDALTDAEADQLRAVIAGIDKAMDALDADLKSLTDALDNGVSWEVASEIRRCMFGGAKCAARSPA